MLTIRSEKPEDVPSVHTVNEQAFEQPSEADLVDKLRQSCPEALSFVADDEGNVVGHILFTPAVIESSDKSIQGMGLAPMAVSPERQREGIGSRLVKHGLEVLRDRSCPFVIVLGHPNYYPRFRFEPASKYDIACQWEGVPDEAFMILVLDQTVMKGITGVARYREEFGEAI